MRRSVCLPITRRHGKVSFSFVWNRLNARRSRAPHIDNLFRALTGDRKRRQDLEVEPRAVLFYNPFL